MRAKEHQLSHLRDNLDASLTEKFERDREIEVIQEDLLHTELENERLRSSLRNRAEGDMVQRWVYSNTKLVNVEGDMVQRYRFKHLT